MKTTKPPRRPTLAMLIDAQRESLDEIAGALELGIRNQRHFDELEGQAQAVADGIVAAFRGART